MNYTSDFHYITDGCFYTLLPNNRQAEKISVEIDKIFEGDKIPVLHWNSVRQRLKEAGYKVHKLRLN